MKMFKSARRLCTYLLLSVPVAFACAMAPRAALAAVQSGGIDGSVVGPDGKTPIAGAVITITGKNIMGSRTDKTDAQGRFHVIELPPGLYTVTFESTGYVKQPVENVQVNIDRTQTLNITLQPPEAAGQTVNVEASRPTIDVTQTQGGEVVNKDFLTKLPVDQDYLSVARMVPGVIGTGNSNVQGSSSSENMFLVDGVNITDPVTNTFSANFNFESIEQVEVLTGGFDPEHQALGGVINVVTKSGGNDFHGGITQDYHDDRFSPRRKHKCARYADGYTPTGNDLDDQQHCAEIVEFSEFGTQQVDYTTNLFLGGPVLRDKLWFFASFEHVESFSSTYHVQGPRNFNGEYFQGKLTYQPASRHKLTFSFETDPTLITRVLQDPYTPAIAEAQQAQGGFLLSFEHLWFTTDKFVVRNSLTYASQFIDFGPFSRKGGRFNFYSFDPPVGNLTLPGHNGILGADSSVNFTSFSFNRRERIQYSPKATYFLDNLAGNHEISAGIDFALTKEDQLSGVTGNVEYIDRRQTAFDASSAVKNYYYVETSGPLRQKTNGLQSALYLQDAWKPLEKLTVRGGFRFDRGGLYNDTGSEVLSFFSVSPRLYAAYDLTGDGKTVVRGGYGRFVDPGKLSQSDFLNRHGTGQKLFLGDYFGLTDNGAGNLYFGTTGEATTLRAHKVTVPRTDSLRLGAERDVTHGLAVGLTWNAKWTTHLFEDDESNLIWNGNGTQTVGNRIGIIDNRFRIRTPGSARRYFQDVEATIRRRFGDGLELLGSYTWSQSLGTTPDQFSGSLDVPPQNKYDFGYLPGDRTNVVRLSAAYEFNFGLTMGTTVNYLSGPRMERLVWNDFANGYTNRTAPRNHGLQLDGAPNWNIKFQYGPKLPGNWGKVRGELTVLNVLNNRQIAGYQQSQYDARGVLYPAGRYEPLSVRLGGRYEF